ncbi:MAG: putative transcriptional regulatory protein [Chlamydiae bacterium]|nr:putative transcriptional regulatory protein [Chlamydiota bacterium]
MAGHSKWANIKHKKERSDAKKGKIFSKIAKEIITAVKLGGPDPKGNPRLRLVLQKAKAANMPNDNIERNIKKAASQDTAGYEECLYELYGHGGVGILVEAMTDNKNRTASDLRIATNKKGGTIALSGSVSFNFEKKGVIHIKKDPKLQEKLFNCAIEHGAEDFDVEEDEFIILTPPESLYEVKEALETITPIIDAELQWICKNLIACNEETQAKNMALIDFLEDLDDVDNVYHNMEV